MKVLAVILVSIIILFATGCADTNIADGAVGENGQDSQAGATPTPLPADTVGSEAGNQGASDEGADSAEDDAGDDIDERATFLAVLLKSFETEKFIPKYGFDRIRSESATYGEIREVKYYSETTEAVRRCYVYTPPDYDEEETYPVLYLLHGLGADETAWLKGAPNEIISNLIAAGEAPPMLVVMPNIRAMTDDRDRGGNPRSPQEIAAFDNFINDLRNDLMPFIRGKFPVSRQREGNAIAGLSMGGKEALYIGITMPEAFGYVGAFSPAWGLLPYEDMGFPGMLDAEEITLPDEYKENTFILINNGNQDVDVTDVPLTYHQALTENGVSHVYYTIDGEHDFKVWKNGLYYFAKSIFWEHQEALSQ